MSQKFHRQRGAGNTIRRIATAEIDEAVAAIARTSDDAETVHAVRRRLKRLRALIRLPHRRLRRYRRENVTFRDLARRLSRMREAEVLGRSFDDIVSRAGFDLPAGLRERLVGAGGHHAEAGELRQILAGEIIVGLSASRRRARHWRLDGKGFELIGEGLAETYRQMREDGLAALHLTDAARLHEWRKQVKYHAAQLGLLAPLAPDILGADRRTADALAEVLGEHHDLDVLRAALDRLDEAGDNLAPLRAAIAERGGALEAEAFRLGDELAAETPSAFRRRIANAWMAWRD